MQNIYGLVTNYKKEFDPIKLDFIENIKIAFSS